MFTMLLLLATWVSKDRLGGYAVACYKRYRQLPWVVSRSRENWWTVPPKKWWSVPPNAHNAVSLEPKMMLSYTIVPNN